MIPKLKAVPKQETKQSVTKTFAPKATKSWSSFKRDTSAFMKELMPDGIKTEADRRKVEAFKREALKKTMPVQQLAFSKTPTVLSPQFIARLRAENSKERKLREPYFFKAAALYARINALNTSVED